MIEAEILTKIAQDMREVRRRHRKAILCDDHGKLLITHSKTIAKNHTILAIYDGRGLEFHDMDDEYDQSRLERLIF